MQQEHLPICLLQLNSCLTSKYNRPFGAQDYRIRRRHPVFSRIHSTNKVLRASIEEIEKYFQEHRATFEKSRTVEASQSRSQTSLSQEVSVASRDSSSMSRYKVTKADAQRTKSKPRNLCSNCSKKSHNENASDYGNAPYDRIKFLEKRIKTLEKEVHKTRKSQGLQQIPGQYFSHVTHDRQKSQEDQFITMCTDMVSKLANIQDPTLKYCWKFIKTNITNALKTNEMVTEMPASSPIKKKVAYLVKQIKEELGVRRTSSVLPMIRKIRQDNEVLNKVYEKILNLFQLKVTHPYMLAYYLEDYTQKINKYQSQTSQTD